MAGRGPLPSGNARRRNAPTIPTTSLPASGRAESTPDVPANYELGEAGLRWWRWAWRTPQAAAWDDGAVFFVARRAQLEDEMAALRLVDSDELADVLRVTDDRERRDALEWLIRQLKGMVGGSTTLMREMRELDNRLGLNPKALAELRWTIVDDAPKEQKPTGDVEQPSNVRPLRPRPSVPGAAAAG